MPLVLPGRVGSTPGTWLLFPCGTGFQPVSAVLMGEMVLPRCWARGPGVRTYRCKRMWAVAASRILHFSLNTTGISGDPAWLYSVIASRVATRELGRRGPQFGQ